MKKTLIAICLSLLTAALPAAALNCYAAPAEPEAYAAEEIYESAEPSANTEISGSGTAEETGLTGDGSGSVTQEQPSDDAGENADVNVEPAEEENVFEYIFGAVSSALAEIFSGGALAASIALLISARRKLFPGLGSAASAIKEQLRDSDERAAEREEKCIAAVKELSLVKAGEEALALTLSNVPERITDAESAVSLLRRAVEGEAELLLELLLATNLPEYRKEMLRDRFSALFPETGGTESSL